MPLFSVIIPVFKVERYLNECIDSVLNQKFTDYEIILIDDASPDNCGKICDEYSVKYKQIIVIHHLNNMGASAARNSGIRRAVGKYLLFLDSDDLYYDGNMGAIYNKLQKNPDADIVFLSMSKFWLGKNSRKIVPRTKLLESEFEGKTVEEMLNKMFENNLFNPSSGAKLIKRELIVNNNLFFREGITGEDLPWTFELLLKIETYLICEADHYMNRVWSGSITRSWTGRYKSMYDLTNFIIEWAEYCKNISNKNRDIYLIQLAYQYGIVMGSLLYFSKDKRKMLADKIKPLYWILKYSSGKKAKKVRGVYNLFGFWLCSFILNMYLRLKTFGLYINEKIYLKNI